MLARAELLLLALLLLALTGCPQSDVGSPCNHGSAFVPQSQTISFPALACNDLLCVYAEDVEPPAEPCSSSVDCNIPGTEQKFLCEEDQCQLDQRYVMSRSMCSLSCETDQECQGGDPDTNCKRGFTCARIQGLGDHCCEKLCVCRDDLDEAAAAELDQECSADTLKGCCDKDPHPKACGT